jgi:hypothetical protein
MKTRPDLKAAKTAGRRKRETSLLKCPLLHESRRVEVFSSTPRSFQHVISLTKNTAEPS